MGPVGGLGAPAGYPPGPTPAPFGGPGVPPGYVPKDKMVAGLLAILIGYLGVHNFYLGNTGKGVAQLLISVLSCGILLPVSWIWSVIEGVQIFTGSIATDANGVPLKG
jgi:TM2 domain-containing membrane protein YozV